MSRADPMRECPVSGCSRKRKAHQMMCWPHWRRVPKALNKAIFDTCEKGPREAYLANRAEAIRIVEEKEAAE